ncbi:MAG TPA: hypothetical protein VG317_19460 [Pseudonocardiaceae bacterium]|jgi:hypothetical protein|nr:hypothetical protein [Pseudonocardiaceae bacterium]
MSCTVAGFAKIEAGTTITSASQPGEIVFYVGADEALVLVFDQHSLAEFLDTAQAALRQARDKQIDTTADYQRDATTAGSTR